ncbi:alcohol dehydrogenase [Russula ochroleuca]|uniref:Alcohol dehydrogenase n=1 Tax=Russula ochroleuca TaxID=152965 RepID=A0A9P5TDR4_9AGAM|nr:alcohol dehydrogenase [Russula ochroleuca]
MLPKHYTRIVLAERPKTDFTPTTFLRETVAFDLKPGPGEVLVRVDWISLDPAMRGWAGWPMEVVTYIPPVEIGAVMRSFGLGAVVEVGEGCELRTGDIVCGLTGLAEYAVMKEGERLQKIMAPESNPPGVQLLDFLGPLGIAGGFTAYFGLLDVAQIKAGETLVVSGAAGQVGSLVCQIGKLYGAKVIGIAGTDEKCRWLSEELKIDAALNYKSPSFREDFKDAVGYLDVFFDNVGGEILNFAITRLKQGARIALCGAISTYNGLETKGITSYMNLVMQRAKIEGFVVSDYSRRYPEALRDLSKWISEGRIIRRYHIIEGLENAPEALPLLFTGGNTGKLLVTIFLRPRRCYANS